MARILFVDDEPNILHGLRRMLRGTDDGWEMAFANSGPEALDLFDEEAFDVVVSDLRMPGMDGVEVLKEIRRRSPQTVRIALSGYADRDSTLRAITQIHQFLSKPCEPTVIKKTLRRATDLSALLSDERIKRALSEMRTLPSMSTLFDGVVKELESPDASLACIGETIAQDPGMSSKVLQLVNSAFFGLPRVVSSPVQGTILLGLETIRTLVMSIKVFEVFEDAELEGVSAGEVWEHSVLVARLAKRIAMAESPEDHVAECAFLAGLLHDVAKLVFAANVARKYRSVLKLADGDFAVTRNLEKKIIGASHGEIGAYLMGLWGFADEIIEAIHLHHAPGEATARGFSPLTAVYAANFLVHHEAGREARYALDRLDMEYLECAGVAERVPLWQSMARAVMEKEVKDETP